MKKKILLGIAAAVMALAIGVTCGTVSHQSDACFSENLEALSIKENDGMIMCYVNVLYGGRIIHEAIICRAQHYSAFNFCSGPQVGYVSGELRDCVYLL